VRRGKGLIRPVHLIITMIKWIRTSRLSIKNSLSLCSVRSVAAAQSAVERLAERKVLVEVIGEESFGGEEEASAGEGGFN